VGNSGPSFYLTGRQPLSPGSVLLAIVAAAVALSFVLFALAHNAGPAHKEEDDPNQVDTIVIGDPSEAPKPAHPGEKVDPSPVHPTILVHLPRWGSQLGMIPDSPAGHLLYNWLAAFNKANEAGLREALPNIAEESTAEIQMEIRKQTGGLSLLSAREIQPGVLVFRMRDQSPAGMEVLGTLQVLPKSNPATIESFSLRAVPVTPPAAAPATAQPAAHN
jgi:hypothetical protein